MVDAKQVADSITFSRVLIGFGLAGLGIYEGSIGLPIAIWAMLVNWTGDSIDGAIARRSRVYYHTWIGDHDLQVDMLVSAGLLVYMLASGFISLNLIIIYLALWLVIFWHWGLAPSLGMLFQAPIYGLFILVAVRDVPALGWWLVIWIVVATIVTWPKFPSVIVPGFLAGIQQAIFHQEKSHRSGTDRSKPA